jgi:hypothetical protein
MCYLANTIFHQSHFQASFCGCHGGISFQVPIFIEYQQWDFRFYPGSVVFQREQVHKNLGMGVWVAVGRPFELEVQMDWSSQVTFFIAPPIIWGYCRSPILWFCTTKLASGGDVGGLD